MSALSVREQLIHELDKLTPEQQEHLLDIARRIQQSKLPPGTPGDLLLARMESFNFAPGEVDTMMRAIEENCERIDWDGWQ